MTLLYTPEGIDQGLGRGRTARLFTALLVLLTILAGAIPLFLSRGATANYIAANGFSAPAIDSLVGRWQMLGTVLSIATAILSMILYGAILAPALTYARFLREIRDNNRRDFVGVFHEMGGDAVREGVTMHACFFLEEGVPEPRKCYYDASLPPPDFAPGRAYALTHTGNVLVSVAPAR